MFSSKLEAGRRLFYLDFGCGLVPALSEMFKERGFKVSVFDIFYYNEQKNFGALNSMSSGLSANQDYARYHVITSTEVLEHLANPMCELQRLWALLLSGGVLGLMTKLVTSQDGFKTWHYKNDRIHIAFYSTDCLEWIAAALGGKLIYLTDDAFLLAKQ